MRAEVVNFEWPDLDRGDQSPSKLGMTSLVFIARPHGGHGGEMFQLTVCTPDWLADLVARDGAVIGRHVVFVPTIDPPRVEEVIQDRIRRLDGDSWQVLAGKIGRIAYWEFEDYTERS